MKIRHIMILIFACLFFTATQAMETVAINDEQPRVPKGYGPDMKLVQLKYLINASDIQTTVLNEHLDSTELYFLCPTFFLNSGHQLFDDVTKTHELSQRSFPFHKVPAMIFIALVYDKYVITAELAAALIGTYYAGANDQYNDSLSNLMNNLAGEPWLAEEHYSCTTCAENWINIPFPQSNPNDMNLTIGNQTTHLNFDTFENEQPCPGVIKFAKDYVEQSVANLTLNASIPQLFRNSYKFGSNIMANFTNYQLTIEEGVPVTIEVFNCDMKALVAEGTPFFRSLPGIVIAPVCLAALWARSVIGNKLLSK